MRLIELQIVHLAETLLEQRGIAGSVGRGHGGQDECKKDVAHWKLSAH